MKRQPWTEGEVHLFLRTGTTLRATETHGVQAHATKRTKRAPSAGVRSMGICRPKLFGVWFHGCWPLYWLIHLTDVCRDEKAYSENGTRIYDQRTILWVQQAIRSRAFDFDHPQVQLGNGGGHRGPDEPLKSGLGLCHLRLFLLVASWVRLFERSEMAPSDGQLWGFGA